MREYPECVLIVDSITGIGAVDCKTDEWGLDVVMTGSQKGLMLPPGLAALTVSPKAWRAYERSTLPKYYFDWKKYQDLYTEMMRITMRGSEQMMKEMKGSGCTGSFPFTKIGSACVQGYDPDEFEKLLEKK